MSDAPNSSARIQQEALETTLPVSESLMFAMGGAINQCLGNSAQVGDIVESMLTLAAFQGLRDTTWVLCDGGSAAGSVYESLTTLATVPDKRGAFGRMKDNGAGKDSNGDLALGAYVGDQMILHTHQEHYRIPNTAAGGSAGGGDNNRSLTDVFENVANAGAGTETYPKYVVVNYFIKINP